MQEPPPEEYAQVPKVVDPTTRAAWRLACANARETQARLAQTQDMPVAIELPQSVSAFWLDVARQLIQRDITNFERYVHVQYRYSTARHGADNSLAHAPNPGSFTSKVAYDRYVVYNRRADRYLRQDFVSASREFECCVTEASFAFPEYTDKQLWRIVLRNRMVDLPPLFRYCVAVAGDLPEVAEEYYDSAFAQFMSDPIGYCAAWPDAITARLKREAEGVMLFEGLGGN
jgi:hypothetical protein